MIMSDSCSSLLSFRASGARPGTPSHRAIDGAGSMCPRLRACEPFNSWRFWREFQHVRPHGEEARVARRLEPWQQVRTRSHPSRRPRFARAPQDEVGGCGKVHRLGSGDERNLTGRFKFGSAHLALAKCESGRARRSRRSWISLMLIQATNAITLPATLATP